VDPHVKERERERERERRHLLEVIVPMRGPPCLRWLSLSPTRCPLSHFSAGAFRPVLLQRGWFAGPLHVPNLNVQFFILAADGPQCHPVYFSSTARHCPPREGFFGLRSLPVRIQPSDASDEGFLLGSSGSLRVKASLKSALALQNG